MTLEWQVVIHLIRADLRQRDIILKCRLILRRVNLIKSFDKWLRHDPVRLAESYVSNLKKLKLIYLDAGIFDEYNLHIGARIFAIN